MTASLGVGGSATRNLDEAVRYMLEICANMDAKWISCVRRHRDNLLEFMPLVVEETVFVPQSSDCEFLGLLIAQINHFKSIMQQIPEVFKSLF